MALQKIVSIYTPIVVSRRWNPWDLVTNKDVKIEGGEESQNDFQNSGLGNKVDVGAISKE